jgi:hypothetical protein
LEIFLSGINLHARSFQRVFFLRRKGKIVSNYYTKTVARNISEASGTRGDKK